MFIGIFISVAADENSLPVDADPDQTLYYPLAGDTGTYIDFMKTVYDCVKGASYIVCEPLFKYDKEQEIVPMGVKSWEIADDWLRWTFHLKEELTWSDGKPLTAHDYVFAMQRAVTQGYDFSWYWGITAGIKNWERVEKGELPVEELGIKALGDFTLEIITEVSKPYLLGVLTLLYPVPQHMVKEYGDEYATRAETMVSNGPFKVSEWIKGSHITCIANPNYRGIWKPYLEKIVLKYGTIKPEIGLPAFLNEEIYKTDLNAGQLAYVRKNIPEELHSWPEFSIYYLSFDTTKPPFDDVRVRQAFNHALNREELCSTVLKDLAMPEYSVLVTGFPGSDPAEAMKLSEYNPTLAKKLLAEAGYPEGKGFPELDLWIKSSDQTEFIYIPAASYIQAQFKEKLGINIVPKIVEKKTFTDAQNQYGHNFFFANYGYDYLDPSNFMDIFLSGGRQAWFNSEYDDLVREADVAQGWDKRMENYRKAEKILVQEAPITVLFQKRANNAWKEYLKGEGIEPDKKGNISWSSKIETYILTHTYISNR